MNREVLFIVSNLLEPKSRRNHTYSRVFIACFSTFVAAQGSEAFPFWAFAGKAGNSFAPSLVKALNGDLLLHHNDESGHGGVHRWRISGLDSIVQLVAEPQPSPP
jgi:hypothetical protein